MDTEELDAEEKLAHAAIVCVGGLTGSILGAFLAVVLMFALRKAFVPNFDPGINFAAYNDMAVGAVMGLIAGSVIGFWVVERLKRS